jgi:hypothetical protein
MKTKLCGLIAVALYVVIGAKPADATPVLPIAAPGDTISGSFYLDPTTPVIGTQNWLNYWVNPGTMTVDIGGSIFSSALYIVEVVFPIDGNYPAWRAYSSSDGTLNGETVNLALSLFLLNPSSTSTSLFPLALSSYTDGGQWRVSAIVGQYGAVYSGVVTSLVQVDSQGDFTFSGTVQDYNLAKVVPLPGALPLFATGLGALGLLGWRRRRNSASVK